MLVTKLKRNDNFTLNIIMKNMPKLSIIYGLGKLLYERKHMQLVIGQHKQQ